MTKSTITREPITHYLKIYPEFFSAVCTGVKRAELRKNDRDYRVGDTLHLMETPRGSCHQTGEFINVKITHIADVGEWIPGYVLLSIEREPLHSEPVAYISKSDFDAGYPHILARRDFNKACTMAVYAAQPLPVVPVVPVVPEVSAGDCPAFIKYDITDVDEAWSRGFNAGRAAMLAAAPQLPGGEPATVPGKWIPVSERMPLTHYADCEYSDIEVNVFDGERVFTAHYATGSQPHPCGYWVDTYAKITHWQPLPSAPREDKP